MPKPKCCTLNEEGAAAVEMVMAIPLLMILVAGLLDLSAYIGCCLSTDAMATAAVRYCMDNPEHAETPSLVKSYIAQISPAFASQGVDISISVGEAEAEQYTHHFYTDSSSPALERPNSNISYKPISVRINYTGSFYTSIGRLISQATGGDGSLEVSAYQAGTLDTTDGQTW